MQEMDDNSLLTQYAEKNSGEAFAAIISRHINKVYSVALRQTGNPGHAEEITQAVFVVLARKANSLSKRIILSAWLYETARLTSLTFLRTEIRRARREQEACMQNVSNESIKDTWTEIAPFLDAAMASLNKTDRQALLLRFFDGKNLAEVGLALGTPENTARMRVSRALEKLRRFFAKYGVRSTTDIIAGAISSNCVQNAPPALMQSVMASLLAKSWATTGSTLGLAKGVLKAMAWAKAKTAIGAGAAAAALALGAGFYFGWFTPDSNLATFQKFVNGKVPVKEAVVYRQLLGTNGAVRNKEWWRFGYQNGTWFAQRLIPETTNSSRLIPRPEQKSVHLGESFKQFWIVSDSPHETKYDKYVAAGLMGDGVLETADINVAAGSQPESSGSFCRGLMFEALSLGIPRNLGMNSGVLSIDDSRIEWNGSLFKTVVPSEMDQFGKPLATATMTGKLTLGSNGLPTSAEYPGVGTFKGASITYDYGPAHPGIPTAFVVKFQAGALRYEFLSLALGENKLAKKSGYVPSMFADMNLKRIVFAWTNDLPYEQRGGKSYPSYLPPAPKLGERPPPLRGTAWFNASDPLTLDDLHGKVVLVDFSTTSCISCIEALPRMEAVYNKFKSQGLMVIGVWEDLGTAKRVRLFLKSARVTFPNMMDLDEAIADLKTGTTSWTYVLDDNPSYVLIDKSGNLAWKSNNGIPPTESQISGLLAR